MTVVLQSGGGYVERAFPGVPEPHLTSALDPAAVVDEVVIALPAEQLRVDRNRAREALAAEEHAAHRARAGVPHDHLEHCVHPGLVPVAGLQHLQARGPLPALLG